MLLHTPHRDRHAVTQDDAAKEAQKEAEARQRALALAAIRAQQLEAFSAKLLSERCPVVEHDVAIGCMSQRALKGLRSKQYDGAKQR